jgi:hypothetical protein
MLLRVSRTHSHIRRYVNFSRGKVVEQNAKMKFEKWKWIPFLLPGVYSNSYLHE